MISDKPGVWLEATVTLTNKWDRPGILTVDEGIPVPFALDPAGKQTLCVFDNNDGTYRDLMNPKRTLQYNV